MTQPSSPRPVVLCILDGWGCGEETSDNAIAHAHTPVWDHIMKTCPHARLKASAEDVGLPAGQMGNSEVGHMSLGSGRVVMQDLARIGGALADGSLARSPALEGLIESVRKSGGLCHLLGLLSPGGVHSHQDHIAELARIVADRGVRVAVHAFLDGRDTPPSSALGFVERFEAAIVDLQGVGIATVGGRYYAMDRDKRWERTALAYEAILAGKGAHAESASGAIEASYGVGLTDEFMKPAVIGEYRGMADGDGLLMANFRADRVRQIFSALLEPGFDAFARVKTVSFAAALGMTEYSDELNAVAEALLAPLRLKDTLGAVVSAAGLKQLRIAETEKYAHVTYFFNGGEERIFEGEERVLVPSPRVPTYDMKPEMSAYEVTDKMVEAMADGRFDLIVLNYANADMVAHTGRFEPAVKAAEAVDRCLGRLVEAIAKAGGALLITADHGNIECMRDAETAEPRTAHTSNLVPVVLVGLSDRRVRLRDGRLADVAPTLLGLLELEPPAAMTGRSLVAALGEQDVAEPRAALA